MAAKWRSTGRLEPEATTNKRTRAEALTLHTGTVAIVRRVNKNNDNNNNNDDDGDDEEVEEAEEANGSGWGMQCDGDRGCLRRCRG
jgi:hypothetical protein